MITRRRGRALEQECEEQPVEVEVCDAQTFDGAEDLDAALELDQLFGDFKWTLDRDAPLFDVDLDLDRFTEPDSGRETSSPERAEPAPRRNGEARGPNKNAIAARLNRIKKKEYVSGLEREVSGLSGENGALRRQNAELTRRVDELEAETRYLRAVLANDSTLARLLARLGGAGGIQLSPPRQPRGGDDHDYALPLKRARPDQGGGVCLHVDRDRVSVEFCAKCSERAKM